jgi:predicted ATPase
MNVSGGNINPSFVDRTDELETMKTLYAEAANGRGIVLFVYGEAGIGKTRLVEEFKGFVVSQGATFLKGTCLYREESSPYLPFIEALGEQYKQRESGESITMGIMGVGSEQLDTPMGFVALEEEAEAVDLQKERARMFETMSGLIMKIAADNPLVLFLDDLQWADSSTLSLLHHVARNIRAEKIMIIAAYRPEDLTAEEGRGLTELIQRMKKENLHVSIKVNRLDKESIETMVKGILKMEDAPPAFLDKLFEESEGNPYFVEEVVKSLVGGGMTEAVTDSELNLLLEDMKIPPTIKEVMWRRIGRLDEDSTKVLMLASVIGSSFEFEVLRKASGFEDMRFLDALDKLIHMGLVHEKPSKREELYEFDHAQVRGVIYDSLTRSRKRLMHEKIGEVLEEHFATRIGEAVYALARHFHIGRKFGKALHYALLSAEKATKQFALDEALSFYETSLEIIGHLTYNEENRETTLDINMKMGKLLFTQGRFPEALSYYDKALGICDELGKKLKKARVFKDIGHVHKYTGDYSKAEQHFERALEVSTQEESAYDIADIHRGLGYIHWRKGEFGNAIEHYNQSISNIEKIGDENLLAVTLLELGNVYNTKGDLDMATDYHTRSVKLLNKLGDYVEISRALNNLADSFMQKGDFDSAITHLERAVQASERSGSKQAQAWAIFNVAEAYIVNGEMKKAEEALEKSLIMCEALGEKVALQGVYKNYGLFYRVKKDWDKSIEYYEKALELLKEVKVPYETAKRLYEMALVYKDMGDKSTAEGLLFEARSIFREVAAKNDLEKVRILLDSMTSI